MTIYDELINFHRTTGEFDKALYFCRQALRFAQKEDREDTRRYGDAKDRLNEAVRIYQLRQNFSSDLEKMAGRRWLP